MNRLTPRLGRSAFAFSLVGLVGSPTAGVGE